MNEKALMQYVSHELHTYVRKFNAKQKLTDEFCGRPDLKKAFYNQQKLYPVLFEYVCSLDSQIPLLLLINNVAVYTLITIPDGFYLIGPSRFSSQNILVHHIKTDAFPIDVKELLITPDYSVYIKNILLVQNLYHSKYTTEEMLWNENLPSKHDTIQQSFSDTVFTKAEEGSTHNSYEQELREQYSIEHGDSVALKNSIDEDNAGSLGILASNPLRNAKNIGIVVITLASRSAIRGGLLPEIAFSLSDSYIRQLEETQDIPSVQKLVRKAEFQYTELVHEIIERKKGITSKKNPYIMQCKNYIFSHLHDKITVQNIAKELNINANYLSGLFKEQEGISLSRYILEEKISRAKNLLTYSQYSYIQIATYLGFSSQSHFISQFKNVMGCTPKEYRDAFGLKKF